MRPSRLKPFIIDCIKHQRFVMIEGAPGVGKSEVVDQAVGELAKDGSAEHIITFPYMEDPTVPAGFPFPSEDKKYATFLPFGAMYRALNSQAKWIVWNLEDFGWADFSMQKAYANLVTRRMFNGTRLPDRLCFIATTNRSTDASGVAGFMEALKSRCDTIAPFDTNLNDWISWATDHDMPLELIVHIRNHPDQLHKFKATKELKQSPCPRNWAHVGGWVNQGYRPDLQPIDNKSEKEKQQIQEYNMMVKEIYTGAVGQADATEFYATFEMIAKAPNVMDIEKDPTGAPVPELRDASILYAVATAMAFHSNKSRFANFLKYAVRMPKPFEVLFVKDTFRRHPEISGTKEFVQWANKPVNADIVC